MNGRKITSVSRYISDHWKGHHSVAWSLWVNLLGVRAVLFLTQELLTAALPSGFVLPIWVIIPLVVFFHGLIFAWQVVGLIRAADRHCRSSGQMYAVLGTHLALVVAVLWVLSYSLEAWHLTQPNPDNALPSLAELDAQRKALYDLKVSSQQTALTISGSLEHGITARVTALLNAHPTIKTIHLASPGGNIFEARGLAAQIRTRGLDTSIRSECSSACSLAFMGGKMRTIAVNAKLGFHQYRLDTDIVILAADPSKEQQRDLATFQQAGVAPWFLDRLFQSGPKNMWYPEVHDLLRAGVITGVAQFNDREE